MKKPDSAHVRLMAAAVNARITLRELLPRLSGPERDLVAKAAGQLSAGLKARTERPRGGGAAELPWRPGGGR